MKIETDHIIKKRTVNKSVQDVWTLWTTHEGLKQFFGEDNKIELTIGGAFEIYFLMDNYYGLRGAEGCKVLSFVKEKSLAFSWNAPPQFPDIRNAQHYTWVVVELEAQGDDRTLVTLTHAGWPHNKEWEPVKTYFQNAWDRVMASLEEICL